MKRAIAYLLCGTVLLAATAALAIRTIPVDQITDAGATAAKGMFSFAPDYVEIDPGEEINFLNGTGEHTVHAVPELWPKDVKRVAISNRPDAKFTFEKEGFYGVTCRRHGQYGMVLLVKVGDPEGSEDLKDKISKMRGSVIQKKALTSLVDEHLSQ